MKKWCWCGMVLVLVLGGTLFAEWRIDAVQPSLKVLLNETVIVSGSDFQVNGQSRLNGAERAESELPGGGRAVSYFNRTPPAVFRQEVAVNADGSEVEITFQSCSPAYEFETPALHVYQLTVPFKAVENMRFAAVTGRAQAPENVEGVLAADWRGNLTFQNVRYLALSDGKGQDLVFDFNPNGVGNSTVSDYQSNNFRGMWAVVRDGDQVKLYIGWKVDFFGASQQTKVKIFSGTMADYDRRHAMRSYTYHGALAPQRLYRFGAGKAGKNYTALDAAAYDSGRGAGWLGQPDLTPYCDAPSGALYAGYAGRNARFKWGNLVPGVYLVTWSAGNYGNHANRFNFKAGDRVAVENFTVTSGEAAAITVPVRVAGDELLLEFEGDFLISTLGLQFLLAEAEDHSCFRGFWRSAGYEPGVLFHNAHYAKPPAFAVGVDRFRLPEPGKEASGTPRPAPELKAVSPAGNLDWRYHARIAEFASGSANLSEFDTPERLERRMRELEAAGINTVMISGLHSRHTYPAHRLRVREYLKNLVEAAHRHNIRVVDHEDFGMLWNMDSGFRLLTEITPMLHRDILDTLPSTHICPMNPEYRKRFFDYVTDLVGYTGLDGIMIDEMSFWAHGCGCGVCRNRFQQDTGWQLPADELSPDLNNLKSPLWQRWVEWRKAMIGDWWVALREAVNQVRPECSFLIYTTHYGLNSTYASARYGHDLFHLARGNDFLGTEIMSRNILQSGRSVFPYRKAKNIFRLERGTPIFGLVYPEGDYDLAYFGWAMNNMLGQVSWEPITARPDNRRDYHQFPDNMDLAVARPVADIGLLFSAQSRDWNTGLDFSGELYAAAQTLDALHEPYLILSENGLTPDILKQFKLLYVGAAQCLSDRQIQILKDFARAGGTLYLTTCTGIGDEFGRDRSRWAFADVTGFNVLPRSINVANVIHPETGKPFTPRAKPIVFRFGSPMPKPEQVRLRLCDQPDATYPLLVVTPYGKGRIVYQSMAIGTRLTAPEGSPQTRWNFVLDEPLDATFKAIWKELLGSERPFGIDVPEKVFVSVYRQDGGKSTAVHLLNGTGADIKSGETMRSGAPDPAFPSLERDIEFTIALPELCQEVYLASPDFDGRKPLDFRTDGKRVTVTVPGELLKTYAIVWLKSQP